MTNSHAGPRFAVATLGCRLNQAESDELERKLAAAGLVPVEPEDSADIYVVNTCTVTHIADRKARHLIRHLKRLNPAAVVVATGCYAQVAPGELSSMPEVDLVVPNRQKDLLPEIILRAWEERFGPVLPRLQDVAAGACTWVDRPGRARALLKIQDGCNYVCAFCIVPRARGRHRSVPVPELVERVRAFAAEGFDEVVLTGVCIGAYGLEWDGRPHLYDLVRTLLDETPVRRIRFSSIDPADFDLRLLDLYPSGRLCRHFHLPLQSGSDAVLRRMRRRYTAGQYRELVEAIRSRIPGAFIAADVIVGFPGESEADFEATFDLCRELGFAGLHVFRYSPRPGTLAARFPDQVPEPVKRARSERLIALAEELAAAFRASQLGATLEVVVEGPAQCGPSGTWWEGLSDNYLRVHFPAPGAVVGRIRRVRITGIDGDLLLAEPV